MLQLELVYLLSFIYHETFRKIHKIRVSLMLKLEPIELAIFLSINPIYI